jgi:hypothetical protein
MNIVKKQCLGMKLGMLLIIVGGATFLTLGLLAQSNLAVIGGLVGWACGAATTVYASANDAIKKLNQRIVELEGQNS